MDRPAPGTTPRLSRLETRAGGPAPRLIINPHAGQKLGLSTNTSTVDAVQAALQAAGVNADLAETQGPGHATELARTAASEGVPLVIAAGGDGTVAEVADGVLHTETAVGVMPLGSIMNIA